MNRGPTLAAAVAVFVAMPVAAQAPGFTPGPWNRVATDHFEFLYPDALDGWTRHMAERMEAVHASVAAMVGYAPEDRVTVLVDDPGNVSNGSMNPGPLLYMWPTPPNPRSMIGENRGWGEILAVHEFAHAAHLMRPSRNPQVRFITSMIPVPVTNLMRIAPRWVTEGYATYVEGRLTGSGRPHGVWRPAVLRVWALEGQLPTYGAVSRAAGYYGGSMAYLMGSAYLEWLVAREGGDEEVLPNLWRRLTARQERSFGGAFTGVFGASPDELYGLFTVDVTERALAVRDAVEAAGGAVEGELFQRYSWSTGDPAVSPDGERLAVLLTSEDDPSRLVVVNTAADTMTTEQRERYAEIFEEDPEDVEPVQRRPRAQRPEATLRPAVGRAYHSPAWMPDGEAVLVIRSDVVSNGRSRPDLFLWSWEDGEVRRVTRGAAIREAAPSPDGTWAVGVRCLHAACDIVRIELDDGAVTTVAGATPLRPYYHPRVSPDGRTIVASAQVDGEWRLVAMDADGSDERLLGPADGAARYDAEFLDDGRLVLTSTAGGIHDIELLDPGSGEATPLTRVVGSAVAPSPAPDGTVFFLSLHSRGWDLRRLRLDDGAALPEVGTAAAQFPAATVPLEPGDTFPAADLPPARGYGLGPRFRITLPMGYHATDGSGGGLAVSGTDPIGRLGWQLQGMYGSGRAPVGASLRTRYRGVRPWLAVDAFWARHEMPVYVPGAPAALPDAPGGSGPTVRPDEAGLGAPAALELRGDRLGGSRLVRAGGSVGRLEDAAADRLVAFGEARVRLEQRPGTATTAQWLAAHAAIGRSGDLDWTRWRAEAGLSFRADRLGVGVTGQLGGTDAPFESVERFVVGGAGPLLVDPALVSQRVAMPALAGGALVGTRVRTVRADIHDVLPAAAFFWMGDAAGDGLDWTRVVGIELDEATPAFPYLRLPATRVRLGAARVLNGPSADQWRFWAMLGYAP